MSRATELPRRHPLFTALPAARRAAVLAASHEARYRRGHVIFRQGAAAEAFWVVLDGWVHLVRAPEDAADGDGIVVCTITPEEGLCGISAMEAGAYTTSGVAATACRVLEVPAPLFLQALESEPGFACQVLRLLARRTAHMAQQYGMMAEPVAHRLIRTILRLRQQFGDRLPVTHRELGQMAWTTTESAIRVVRSLKQQGYLAGSRGWVLIREPSALAKALALRNGHRIRT